MTRASPPSRRGQSSQTFFRVRVPPVSERERKQTRPQVPTGPSERTGHELSWTSHPRPVGARTFVPRQVPLSTPEPQTSQACFSRNTVYSTGDGLKASSSLGWGRVGENGEEQAHGPSAAAWGGLHSWPVPSRRSRASGVRLQVPDKSLPSLAFTGPMDPPQSTPRRRGPVQPSRTPCS